MKMEEIWMLVLLSIIIIFVIGAILSCCVFISKIWEHINVGHTYNISGGVPIKIDKGYGHIEANEALKSDKI